MSVEEDGGVVDLAFMAQSNLWPLLVILTAPLAFVYLVALSGARALAR